MIHRPLDLRPRFGKLALCLLRDVVVIAGLTKQELDVSARHSASVKNVIDQILNMGVAGWCSFVPTDQPPQSQRSSTRHDARLGVASEPHTAKEKQVSALR